MIMSRALAPEMDMFSSCCRVVGAGSAAVVFSPAPLLEVVVLAAVEVEVVVIAGAGVMSAIG